MSFQLSKSKLYIASIIAGVLAVFAYAPYGFLPAFIISIIILLFIIDHSKNLKSAITSGYLYGLGFFIGGLHWFCYALMTDFKRLFWLIPFSATTAQAFLALYIGIFGFLSFIKFKNEFYRIYFLACSWTIIEWLRGNLFSGFPWIISGYAFDGIDGVSQLASITGIYGLSFLILIISLSFNLLLKLRNSMALINFIIIAICTISIQYYGIKKIEQQDLNNKAMPQILLVQIGPTDHITNRKEALARFYDHLNLTKQYYSGEETIIWPESSHPFLIDIKQNQFGNLFNFMNEKSKLILGSPSVTYNSNDNSTNYWNSILSVNRDGTIENHYNKMHLVPFGEYIPFYQYLPPIKIITERSTSYSSQNKMEYIKINDHYFRPLICYEAIFSDHPIDPSHRADYIINITNDNWYGDSLGPYQHFSMTKFRAIEQGMPLVRVAISGISAVIDSYGRVVNKIDLNHKGVISSTIPQAQLHKALYSIRLEKIMIAIFALLAAILFMTRNYKLKYRLVDKIIQ